MNTFQSIDPSSLARTAADFEGETTDNRLARRKQRWIPNVSVEK